MNRTTTFHKNSVIVPHYLVYYVPSINKTNENLVSLIVRRRTNRGITVLCIIYFVQICKLLVSWLLCKWLHFWFFVKEKRSFKERKKHETDLGKLPSWPIKVCTEMFVSYRTPFIEQKIRKKGFLSDSGRIVKKFAPGVECEFWWRKAKYQSLLQDRAFQKMTALNQPLSFEIWKWKDKILNYRQGHYFRTTKQN